MQLDRFDKEALATESEEILAKLSELDEEGQRKYLNAVECSNIFGEQFDKEFSRALATDVSELDKVVEEWAPALNVVKAVID